MKKTIVFGLFLILAIGLATAQIDIISPKDNETVTSVPQSFIFSISEEYRDIGISNCTLIVDDASVKTYNFFPNLLSIKINAELMKGTLLWKIECYTKEDELISTEPRTIFTEPPMSGTEGITKKVGSGMTSQGTRWIFDISLLNKKEVVLNEIRPLDIIELTLKPRSYSDAFQSKDEYFQIYIIKTGTSEGRSFLDIKAGGSENKRAFLDTPLDLDVDGDDKNEIAFKYMGPNLKKNVVAISSLNIIPEVVTPAPEEEQTVIEEDTTPTEDTEDDLIPTLPVEGEEETTAVTPIEPPQKSNKIMVFIVLIIIVLVVVVIGIYMYMTNKMNEKK